MTNIYANRFVPATGWGTAGLIETSTYICRNPRLAATKTGEAVAVWEGVLEKSPGNRTADMYLKLVRDGRALDLAATASE